MATIERFQDVDAWQKARKLCKLIYKITNQKQFSKDYGLVNQIRRAAVSVMSNIAEGFERGGNREFIHFLTIAKASVAEIESQLYIALDNEYIVQNEFNEIYAISKNVRSIISGFIRYLKKSEYKGAKFKS
jgi:four helix bundle protein